MRLRWVVSLLLAALPAAHAQSVTGQISGAVTDPAFGKLVAFGLGGILVEVLKDITFRLAPATNEEALSILDACIYE